VFGERGTRTRTKTRAKVVKETEFWCIICSEHCVFQNQEHISLRCIESGVLHDTFDAPMFSILRLVISGYAGIVSTVWTQISIYVHRAM
jgi:hypothetical protein